MSVATTTSKIQYTLTTGSQALSIPFYFLDNAHIKAVTVATETVASITLVLGTDYTLTGAANPAGGTLTTIATIGNALAAGSKVVIKRNVPITQPTSYSPNDAFPAKVHEGALDRGVMQAQQLNEKTERALSFAEDDSTEAELPSIADRSNKALGFNSTGGIAMKTLVGAGGMLEDESVGESALQGAFRSRAVASVALMEAQSYANAKQNDRVELLGYNEAGDGGGGLLYFDLSDTITARNGVTVFVASDGTRIKRVTDCITPDMAGAKGDGSTLDTAAIQAAATAAISAGIPLKFTRLGPWKSNKIQVGAPLTFIGNGAQIDFVGSSVSTIPFIELTASFSGFTVENLIINGSGTLSDNQYGIGPTNSGISVSNVSYINVRCQNLTVGLDMTAVQVGTVMGGKIGPTLGITTGHGYGVVFGQGSSNCKAIGVTFYRCTRHSLYVTGDDSSSIGCTFIEHGYGETPSNTSALVLAYSKGQTATGNVFRDCIHNPVEIDDDSNIAGVSGAVAFTGNTFYGCQRGLIIGTPGVIGADRNTLGVTVSTNVFNMAADASECVHVNHGADVSISSNVFRFESGTAPITAIVIDDVDTASPKNLTVTGNEFYPNTSSGTKALIYIDVGSCSSSSGVSLYARSNSVNNGGSFILAGATLQNPNINTDDTTALAMSGATPYVAGSNRFYMTNAGATNVTNFLGGYEGQRVTILFGDNNSTLKNTNFYMAGAADFVATNNDTITFERFLGAWREVSRTVV